MYIEITSVFKKILLLTTTPMEYHVLCGTRGEKTSDSIERLLGVNALESGLCTIQIQNGDLVNYREAQVEVFFNLCIHQPITLLENRMIMIEMNTLIEQ